MCFKELKSVALFRPGMKWTALSTGVFFNASSEQGQFDMEVLLFLVLEQGEKLQLSPIHEVMLLGPKPNGCLCFG